MVIMIMAKPKQHGNGNALEHSIKSSLDHGKRFTIGTSDIDGWYAKLTAQYPDAKVTKGDRCIHIEGK